MHQEQSIERWHRQKKKNTHPFVLSSRDKPLHACFQDYWQVCFLSFISFVYVSEDTSRHPQSNLNFLKWSVGGLGRSEKFQKKGWQATLLPAGKFCQFMSHSRPSWTSSLICSSWSTYWKSCSRDKHPMICIYLLTLKRIFQLELPLDIQATHGTGCFYLIICNAV